MTDPPYRQYPLQFAIPIPKMAQDADVLLSSAVQKKVHKNGWGFMDKLRLTFGWGEKQQEEEKQKKKK